MSRTENDEISVINDDYHDKTTLDEAEASEASEEYYPLPRKSTRLYSIISLVLALVALGISFIYYYIGIALGVGAIVFSLVSRALLGYFDKASVFGLLVGIFGIVFSAFTAIVVESGVLEGLF